MCMNTEPRNGALLRFPTAIGTCGLRWGGKGISAVLMPGSPRLATSPAASAGAAAARSAPRGRGDRRAA